MYAHPDSPRLVTIVSKDDITAGDGAKHDVIAGKGAIANRTTCNVFRYLQNWGAIPLAFVKQVDETSFIAERCEMIAWEVVVRRLAYGSYLKRDPAIAKGHRFPELVLEFFLKTSGRQWNGISIPKDDPLALLRHGPAVDLYLPDQPISEQKPFLTLTDFPLCKDDQKLEQMRRFAHETFIALEWGFRQLGKDIADFKVEFGINQLGDLRLADVIDNDSWRLLENGEHLDKQAYREGEGINEVTAKYLQVAELTDRLSL